MTSPCSHRAEKQVNCRPSEKVSGGKQKEPGGRKHNRTCPACQGPCDPVHRYCYVCGTSGVCQKCKSPCRFACMLCYSCRFPATCSECGGPTSTAHSQCYYCRYPHSCQECGAPCATTHRLCYGCGFSATCQGCGGRCAPPHRLCIDCNANCDSKHRAILNSRNLRLHNLAGPGTKKQNIEAFFESAGHAFFARTGLLTERPQVSTDSLSGTSSRKK